MFEIKEKQTLNISLHHNNSFMVPYSGYINNVKIISNEEETAKIELFVNNQPYLSEYHANPKTITDTQVEYWLMSPGDMIKMKSTKRQVFVTMEFIINDIVQAALLELDKKNISEKRKLELEEIILKNV